MSFTGFSGIDIPALGPSLLRRPAPRRAGIPTDAKYGKTRRSILVSEKGDEKVVESLSEEIAGRMDDHQSTALFDRHADPSLPARMKFQALMMAGVVLMFLSITIAIGIVLPAVRAWLQ